MNQTVTESPPRAPFAKKISDLEDQVEQLLEERSALKDRLDILEKRFGDTEFTVQQLRKQMRETENTQLRRDLNNLKNTFWQYRQEHP